MKQISVYLDAWAPYASFNGFVRLLPIYKTLEQRIFMHALQISSAHL